MPPVAKSTNDPRHQRGRGDWRSDSSQSGDGCILQARTRFAVYGKGVPKGKFLRGEDHPPRRSFPGTQHTYYVYVPAQYDPTITPPPL